MDGHPTDGNGMFCGNSKCLSQNAKILNYSLHHGQFNLRLAVQLLKVDAALLV